MVLQHWGRQLGVKVLLTPKFHAELAGEGVEYSWWAHANAYYWLVPVSRKYGCDNFKQLVKDWSCPTNVQKESELRSLHQEPEHTSIFALSIILSERTKKAKHQLMPSLFMRIQHLKLLLLALWSRNYSTLRLKGSWMPSRGTGVPSTSTEAWSIPNWRNQQQWRSTAKRRSILWWYALGVSLIAERFPGILLL